ncbi:hypothetical protein ACFVKB_01450 [Rhodococcus sp. NPDC127530]|uniref:hypothetical protein n=1 Tax=unclassified Rhodococcus (in: high G+C Gram-positive bacteria) TaxID=192944 RepID=UPI0036257327
MELPAVAELCDNGLAFERPVTVIVGENGDDGIDYPEWNQLDLVRNWRSFLDGPDRFLRHL